MIVRPKQHWFRRLFVWHGSVLSEILFRLSLNLGMSIVAILCFQWYEALGIKLTLAPFSLLGVAIAIFLGFRNSVSYARFTEARVLWGSLLIVNRSLLRQIKSIFPQRRELAQEFSALQIAFSYCLKHQLRGTAMNDDLARILPDHDWKTLVASSAPCNRILLLMGEWLGEKRQTGEISDIIFQSIDENLNKLSAVLAGCERISNTPIPYAYSLIVHRTVYLFCTLLPFALVPDLHYMTPLVSVFISYTFISLDALAEELEDPFGTAPNDLPLNAMCKNMEINLLEMNDETELPAKLLPDKRYQLK
ncbi:bestrophin family ion channel [Rouxiella sp. T17]|uniref:bestrophin family protein n=1 Tax=Rouxiella sp. T17 TaxID=3085684 RepID=UPI002FC69FFC